MRSCALWNFPAFAHAAAQLRDAGYEVVSPHEHDLECGFDPSAETLGGFDLKAAFRWDMEQVLSVDAVAVLPGWEASKGAKAEVAVAEAIGTPVYSVLLLLARADEVTA